MLLFNRLVVTVFLIAMLVLIGCSSTKNNVQAANDTPETGSPSDTQAQLILPNNVFQKAASQTNLVAKSFALSHNVSGQALKLNPTIWLYASPTSKAFFKSKPNDLLVNISLWERFLSKYKIPFKMITTPELLAKIKPGVLILPSLVALSMQERQSISQFRQAGGSILATWLTGVINEQGDWSGFDFMQNVLNVNVLGDTQDEDEENFMMPFGDSPVSHSLPAGQRIWLERIPGYYPLRLEGQQPAAFITDWERSAVLEKPGTTLVFDETEQNSGALSRSVHTGFSEHLWLSADPKAMDALAHNALTWLLRQPDAYLSAWPFPYKGALTIVVDSSELVDDLDVKFAANIAKSGAKATFYVVTGEASKSAAALKSIQSQGHEIAYMADQFENFAGQPAETQKKRLLAMQQELKAAGLSTGQALGFHAPMESTDKNTFSLLNQLGFTYIVAMMDATEDRLPFMSNRNNGSISNQQPMVILPRTQSDPIDLIYEGDPGEGLKQYLSEFELSVRMGGLTLVQFPDQRPMSGKEQKAIFQQIKDHSKQLWSATNADIAYWWLERDRLKVELTKDKSELNLSVSLTQGKPLVYPSAVIINLPYPNDLVRIFDPRVEVTNMAVQNLDPWRAAISLANLKPGKHRWRLQFKRKKNQ